MKFNETWLKTLQPKSAAYRVFEKNLIKGFGVQVTPKGVVSFFLCYQEGTSTRYKTLGKYPEMSLQQAREAAIATRNQVNVGQPVGQRIGTLQQLCDVYYADLEDEGAKSLETIKRILQTNVVEVLGADRLAREITAEDVRLVMHKCIARDAGTMANRIRSYLMSAFKSGIYHDNDPRNLGQPLAFNLPGNPVDLVPKITSFERVGERVLSMDELKLIWNYQGSRFSQIHLMALKILMLAGGLRPSEVTQAAKDEFDFSAGTWSIPPARSKNGKWHVIPITDNVASIIHHLYAIHPGHRYLFPNASGSDRPEHRTSLGHAVVRLIEDLQMEPWSVRDLRRTFKTLSGQAGLSKEIRDRLQNHALADVSSRHYDRYLYVAEKRSALLQWEEWLLSRLSD